MSCHNCARQTLNLFIRSFIDLPTVGSSRRPALSVAHSPYPVPTGRRQNGPSRMFSRPLSALRKLDISEESKNEGSGKSEGATTHKERLAWQVQKNALKEKFGGEAWSPRKKLSPDTMEGIRHLHKTQPVRFTTPVLANHFKVSPEAIRRILKSKWQPSDEEHESRMQRWDKRGERIWSNLVEMGVKPPKVWRQMGVGRSANGEAPKWKARRRHTLYNQESPRKKFGVEERDILPIVDGSGKRISAAKLPLSERL